ncbi:MAG: alpha/beta fold hydrolase [Gammaproteobacteria bacterium]
MRSVDRNRRRVRRDVPKAGVASDVSSGTFLPPSTFSPEVARTLDRMFNAWMAGYSMGLDPRVFALVALDWWVKLSWSPGTHARLTEKAIRKCFQLSALSIQSLIDREAPPAIEPLPQDHRFDYAGWRKPPFNLMSQSFLLAQQWWANATTGVPALSERRKDIMNFVVRQFLDVMSPSNSLVTNPEVLDATVRERGQNLLRGYENWKDDWRRLVAGREAAGMDRFRPGRDVAITPGKVVFRNHLMELIQYTPSTSQVYAEPVLIVPAWIMKYYILDLSPHNSLVKFLVDKGHTVFMISWRNPTGDDRDLGMDDYRRLGIMAALDVIGAIQPKRRVHSVGYCLGGTLLAIATAAMARNGDRRLKTMTLLAAQTDFSEAGELMLFITDEQVSFLEAMMWDRGVLDTQQMAGAFQLLRSNDLIWSRIVRDYMLGKRRPPNDLMAWNADQTRMPYRMHSEYLRSLLLNNELATGRYYVDEKPIAINDIRIPIFSVASVTDHVAPWKSVYRINLLANSQEVTFLLTTGGHNAGIVSEPGHRGRSFKIATRRGGREYVDPETWQEQTPSVRGSWWPTWQNWLAEHSGNPTELPGLGAAEAGYPPLDDAPGTYVFQR